MNGVKFNQKEDFQKYQTLEMTKTQRHSDICAHGLILPTDCCWRASSSSSLSLGSSLGGRMPFFLRISFHSVSSLGSCGENKACIQVLLFLFSLSSCTWGFACGKQMSFTLFLFHYLSLDNTLTAVQVTLRFRGNLGICPTNSYGYVLFKWLQLTEPRFKVWDPDTN